ncbi:MAG: cupredoxin domain-containing protein, partial [Nitrosopumilaceae archaeon]
MAISLSTLYVMIHLLAVFALATAPFIFFSVYADDTQNEWKITIPNGASGQRPVQGFYPNQLPVLVGDTIVWENKDSVIHSITSGVPEHPEYSGLFFNLGEVSSGKSVSYVMPDTDFLAFYYFCEIHPWMTGKFFNSGLEVAQPEMDTEIITKENKYAYGDTITISGQVHKDFTKTEYTLLIYDQSNNLVDISYGYFDEKSTYLQTINAKGLTWKTNGNYQVKLVYGVPSKASQTSFQFSNELNTLQTEQLIPLWVKNIGGFWCNDKINDSEFVSAVQYLIHKDIIHLRNTV